MLLLLGGLFFFFFSPGLSLLLTCVIKVADQRRCFLLSVVRKLMLVTGSSLVHSLPDIIVSEPASGIDGAAKKSPSQVTDGIHSAIECVKAWIQRPELTIYPINWSMHSSSNV